MRRITWIIILVLTAFFLTVEFSYPADNNDYQIIKKAVQENPKVEPAKEVKWFKLLAIDNKTGKEKVKITMPIALIEIFARYADCKNVAMKEVGCKLNLEELLTELKKAGPLSIMEISEEEETIKVWLE
ncbi:MAG: hypothetical protein JHC32_08255 [Candidatus Aminicenantes bacterium]|jgi:hypothetical protein|nr:hypothetical protein [Candidatus Aminicenantes bacterium]